MKRVRDARADKHGATIEAAHKTCRLASKNGFTVIDCKQAHEDVLLEKIGVKDYLNKVCDMCEADKKASSVVKSLLRDVD